MQSLSVQSLGKLAADGNRDEDLPSSRDDAGEAFATTRIEFGEYVVEDENGLAVLSSFTRNVSA